MGLALLQGWCGSALGPAGNQGQCRALPKKTSTAERRLKDKLASAAEMPHTRGQPGQGCQAPPTSVASLLANLGREGGPSSRVRNCPK